MARPGREEMASLFANKRKGSSTATEFLYRQQKQVGEKERENKKQNRSSDEGSYFLAFLTLLPFGKP